MDKPERKSMSGAASEIYKTFNYLILFYGFLRFCVMFLFTFLILSFFKIPWYYSLIPAIIYFAYYVYSKSQFSKVKVIESHYDDLNEKLSTAVDNNDLSNYFVFSLHQEVRKALKKVTTGSFFNMRRALTDIGTVAVLSVIIIILAQFNFTIARFDTLDQTIFNATVQLYKDAADNIKSKQKASSTGEEGSGGEGEFDDIFGEKSIVELGEEEVQLQISPTENEIDISNEKDEEDIKFESIFPEEIGAEGATSFEERIPKEQQEIVKQYYKNIAET